MPASKNNHILTHMLTHMLTHTVHTFKLWCADTLIGIDEIPTGGIVLAGCRQTLIVLLFTVQAMVTLIGHKYIQHILMLESLNT